MAARASLCVRLLRTMRRLSPGGMSLSSAASVVGSASSSDAEGAAAEAGERSAVSGESLSGEAQHMGYLNRDTGCRTQADADEALNLGIAVHCAGAGDSKIARSLSSIHPERLQVRALLNRESDGALAADPVGSDACILGADESATSGSPVVLPDMSVQPCGKGRPRISGVSVGSLIYSDSCSNADEIPDRTHCALPAVDQNAGPDTADGAAGVHAAKRVCTGSQSTDSQNTGSQSTGSQSTAIQNTGSRNTGSQSTDSPNTGSQSTDSQSTASQRTDSQRTVSHSNGSNTTDSQRTVQARNEALRRAAQMAPGTARLGEAVVRAADLVYVSGALRRVRPYVFEYNTFAKRRWVGRTLGDVFSREYRDRPASYYAYALAAGLVRLNGARAPGLDAVLRDGDMVSHRVHRHEPPVAALPAPAVLHRDDAAGLLVVAKPASVPVHPTGRYRYNTLVEWLLAEDATLPASISLVNRLDRLTSGVCVLTTRPEVAREMQRRMESRTFFRKTYVARVRGVFPPAAECGLPLRTVEHKLALVVPARSEFVPGAKDAHTRFVRLWTDGASESLVLARPSTGRMHQIRVHLLCLGFPIANDPLYATAAAASAVSIALSPSLGGSCLSAPDSTVGAPDIKHELKTHAYAEEMADRDARISALCERLLADERAREGAHAAAGDVGPDAISLPPDSATIPNDEEEALLQTCPDCVRPLPDPRPDDLCIFLHAWRYATPGRAFTAPLPAWARDAEPFLEGADAGLASHGAE